jgi:uracil-DNA glycosylase
LGTLLEKLQQHETKWASCERCAIGRFAHRHVAFDLWVTCPDVSSVGVSLEKETVDVLFIGEGPGTTEDYMGKPFIGDAGVLFREAIIDAEVPGVLGIAFGNVVNCRPTDAVGGHNRQPTSTEANNCADRLYELIEICKPKITVLVGKVAQDYGAHVVGPDYWTLTHPASVLRNGGRGSDAYIKFVGRIKERR